MARPNILLAISDDQSWCHAGAYGLSNVVTPAFDRVAGTGVLFTHGYCPAPQCSPSRAGILTGLNIWQLEEAGTHESLFPAKHAVYPELLEEAGYHVGYTGKPWGPGSWRAGGRTRNPAGPAFNGHRLTPPTTGISTCDYVANFRQFLGERPGGVPFCFWFGCHEPHRNYERDSGVRAGKDLESCSVPGFLPDDGVVKRDLLDYELEVEWFDSQLSAMLGLLEQRGELANTLVVVTSDNGMPFPRTKANLYEYGVHVPLAVSWPDAIPGGRVVHDFATLSDLAPTFLEAANVAVPATMSARSLLPALRSCADGWVESSRDHVLMGKERHNHARRDNVGYPSRAIRTRDFLYIRNFKTDRWPIGDPPGFYCHTKMVNPSKAFILDHRDREDVRPHFSMCYEKRLEEELFRMEEDVDCLRNVATDPAFAEPLRAHRERLCRLLAEQGDSRMLGYGDIFDSYPHFAPKQPSIPGFKEDGTYNEVYWQRAQAQVERVLQRNMVAGVWAREQS